MSEARQRIPREMLEALSRNFCREAAGYGFQQVDFIRFINLLMEAAIGPPGEGTVAGTMRTQPSADRVGPRGHAGQLPLRGERVQVRAFDRDTDLPLLEQWVEEASGRFFVLSRSASARRSIHDMVDSEHTLMGMIALHDGTPIGSVTFLDLDHQHRKAELRKLIGVAGMRGRGYAKEASRLWIDHGLSSLGLRKVYLNTTHTNLRNVKLNEELGFQVEGILRNEICVDGEYHDVLRMGLWRA